MTKSSSLKKKFALVLSLFLISTTLFVCLSNFSLQQKLAFAQSQLDLTTSITTEGRREWEVWGLPVETPPPQFNMVGLSGHVAISSAAGSESLYMALISILNSPSGNCPSEPILFTSGQERKERYPDSYSISNFIVKNIGDGRKEVPTEFTLPIKVPLKGCLFILVGGGNPAERKPITVESHMSLNFDTEPAPSPAPYFLRTSFEFCYGFEGCRASTPEAKAENAFARVKKIDSLHYLWSLSGNISASTFVPPWSSEPEGPWTMEFDYYLYKNCPPPPFEASEFSGPADYYSQIPDDAENLLSLKFQEEGRGFFHQPVFEEFEPKLIEPGNCLVGLTRSVGNGAFSNESQVYTLVQPVPPPFTIQGYKLGCPEGTKIKLDGVEETTAQPYFLHDAPTGTHTVSLELPAGSGQYDIFYSPCDCCTNHPDKSFLSGNSHSFTKDTICEGDHNYYDLYWQCKRKGDLNNDGQVNTQDLKLLLQNWLIPILGAADLNGDGRVNGLDFGTMVKLIP